MNCTLDSTELNKLDACIHCGMCLPKCPTYLVTGSEAESPRGRLYLMKEYAEGQLDSPKQLSEHLDPCLGCLSCATACPSGVDYESLLMASRQELVQYQHPVLRSWRRFWLSRVLPNRFWMTFLARLLRWYQTSELQSVIRDWFPLHLFGHLQQIESFTPEVQPVFPLKPGQVFGQNQKGRVALFIGCLMNAVYTITHMHTVSVLVANGYEVLIQEQTCCGALAHHAGESDVVASLMQSNQQTMNLDEVDWIVVNAAGCGAMLKHYPEEFKHKVVDVMELLAKHSLEKMNPVPMRVAYHAACHLHHGQGVQEEPYDVLRQIPKLELVPLRNADMCCGSAGVYNIAHPQLSKEILEHKIEALRDTKTDAVLAANPGCVLQLETGIRESELSMKVLHPIDLLARAYGYPKVKPRED